MEPLAVLERSTDFAPGDRATLEALAQRAAGGLPR
jgi:hypothetical protein